MKPYRRKDSPVWDVSHGSGTHRIMRSTVIADYSEARRIADDFGVGVPEDAGCGGIGGAPLDKEVARASRPWTILLLQQSAFFKLRTDARHDRRQPLRRCRATSPCRGGVSCRENVSAVVLRPCTTARQARCQPLGSSASPARGGAADSALSASPARGGAADRRRRG